MGLTTARPEPKAKKSFTLSLDTVAFLETIKNERNADSVSAVLEDLLQSLRRQYARAAVDRAVKGYYDSLANEDAAEQVDWARFALQEFPTAEPQ